METANGRYSLNEFLASNKNKTVHTAVYSATFMHVLSVWNIKMESRKVDYAAEVVSIILVLFFPTVKTHQYRNPR